MARYRFSLIIVLFFICTSLFPQVYDHPLLEQIDYMRTMKMLTDAGEDLYVNIDGTPFLNDEFIQGTVALKSGDIYSGEFRYDIYADQVQFVAEGKIYCIAIPEETSFVKIGELQIKFLKYADKKNISDGYLVTLVDGYYSLYAKLNKTLNSPVPEKPYQPAQPGKFVDKSEDYYIKVGENPALRVRNKKDIVAMFPGKEKMAGEFIDSEGIKVNSRFDLVKLVSFLNSNE